MRKKEGKLQEVQYRCKQWLKNTLLYCSIYPELHDQVSILVEWVSRPSLRTLLSFPHSRVHSTIHLPIIDFDFIIYSFLQFFEGFAKWTAHTCTDRCSSALTLPQVAGSFRDTWHYGASTCRWVWPAGPNWYIVLCTRSNCSTPFRIPQSDVPSILSSSLFGGPSTFKFIFN